ncbi:MAG: hypothetical protein IT300_11500 [Dehalococcoidia bacterium]|nr:hypothetical protein [Dehalococcoidia bacterium]
MGALTTLGLNTRDGPIMIVAAPDSVLAEAGAMKPRPSFASTLLTAEPAARLVWWPERRHFDPQTLARLHWLIGAGGGQAWLVLDEAEEESPSEAEFLGALRGAGLASGPPRDVDGGERAFPVAPVG